MAWTGLVLSILAAAGLAYFAVYVAHIQFSEIDWESSSFDEPCVHRTNLPRKQVRMVSICAMDTAHVMFAVAVIFCKVTPNGWFGSVLSESAASCIASTTSNSS